MLLKKYFENVHSIWSLARHPKDTIERTRNNACRETRKGNRHNRPESASRSQKESYRLAHGMRSTASLKRSWKESRADMLR
jgi:hypothetical protein